MFSEVVHLTDKNSLYNPIHLGKNDKMINKIIITILSKTKSVGYYYGRRSRFPIRKTISCG